MAHPVTLEQALREQLLPHLPDPWNAIGEGVVQLVMELKGVQYQGLNPAESRSSLPRALQQIVLSATDAHCVFVRRVNSDGSLELAGPPLWRPGFSPVGEVPRVKDAGEGVSGWAVARCNGHAVVVRDTHAVDENPDAYGAHQLALSAADGAGEEFLRFIHAEACVPLVMKGKPVAVIVAVRGEPYDPAAAERVGRVLDLWREVLVPLYALATVFADVAGQEERLRQLVRAWPPIASAADDEVFRRRLATVLTCDQGLGWHRAMIFRFDGPGSPARCAIAIGGNGDREWSFQQDQFSDEFKSLDQYLRACTDPNYGLNDPLYNLTRDGRGWAVPAAVVAANDPLRALLEGRDRIPAVADGAVKVEPDDPWLRRFRDACPADVFRECAADCPHWLVPLLAPSADGRPGAPLGFVLLDRPYPHRVDLPLQLPLTRLVCDHFAGMITARRTARPPTAPEAVVG